MIRAFNADKPYDEFVREQLAGDLMATGDRAKDFDRAVALPVPEREVFSVLYFQPETSVPPGASAAQAEDAEQEGREEH